MTALRIIAAAVITAALAGTASAQERSGFYAAAKVGFDAPESGDFDYRGALTDVDVRRDHGAAVLVALGYDFGTLRAEIEFGYRHNGLSTFDFGAPAGIETDGTQRSWSGMANLLYDLEIGDITLSAGGGVGLVHATIELDGSSDDAIYPAWQGIIGAGYRLTPQIALTGEYHYMEAFDDPSFRLYGYDLSGAEYLHHTLLASIRYDFAPASP